MSRRTLTLAQLGATLMLGALLATVPQAHAWAADEEELAAVTSTTSAGASVVTDVSWTLPEGASAGDTVILPLDAHAGGVLSDGTWLASSGVAIGSAVLDENGVLRILLGTAADDDENRSGRSIVTTDTTTSTRQDVEPSTASSTLESGHEPGGFFGVADRTRANKFGQWTSADESSARWTIESPRGPWDSLTVSDVVESGQRVDCDAEVTVRSTTQTDPETGYLVGQTPVDPSRASVTCTEAAVEVTVAPVHSDEIVEVSFVVEVDPAAESISNTAAITGTRPAETVSERTTRLEHVRAESPVTPETPGEETPPTEPTPVDPTPVDPESPSTPAPPVPSQLAATGADAGTPALGVLAAGVALLGLALAALGRARAKGGA